jgi:hypothetical protein
MRALSFKYAEISWEWRHKIKKIHSKHVILGESWIVLIKNELNIPDAQLFPSYSYSLYTQQANVLKNDNMFNCNTSMQFAQKILQKVYLLCHLSSWDFFIVASWWKWKLIFFFVMLYMSLYRLELFIIHIGMIH